MKTKYTNLAILTFLSSVLTTESLRCICRAFYLLSLLFFFLSTLLYNFRAFELLCLFSCVSFFLWNNKQAKKFGAWRSVGSFVHSSLHTLQVCGFSYSNSWNVVLVFPVVSFWMWSVVLWFLVFFSFRVRSSGSHLHPIRANQGIVDTSMRSWRCLDAAALINE